MSRTDVSMVRVREELKNAILHDQIRIVCAAVDLLQMCEECGALFLRPRKAHGHLKRFCTSSCQNIARTRRYRNRKR
jgi:hypothetical protein